MNRRDRFLLGCGPAGVPGVVFSAVALVLVAATGLFYPGIPSSFRGLAQRLALFIIFAWMAPPLSSSAGPRADRPRNSTS